MYTALQQQKLNEATSLGSGKVTLSAESAQVIDQLRDTTLIQAISKSEGICITHMTKLTTRSCTLSQLHINVNHTFTLHV